MKVGFPDYNSADCNIDGQSQVHEGWFLIPILTIQCCNYNPGLFLLIAIILKSTLIASQELQTTLKAEKTSPTRFFRR